MPKTEPYFVKHSRQALIAIEEPMEMYAFSDRPGSRLPEDHHPLAA
jgi:hypothetical protein